MVGGSGYRVAASACRVGVLLRREDVRASASAVERDSGAGLCCRTLGSGLLTWLDKRPSWLGSWPDVFLRRAHLLGRRSQAGIPRRPITCHYFRRVGIAAPDYYFPGKTWAACGEGFAAACSAA